MYVSTTPSHPPVTFFQTKSHREFFALDLRLSTVRVILMRDSRPKNPFTINNIASRNDFLIFFFFFSSSKSSGYRPWRFRVKLILNFSNGHGSQTLIYVQKVMVNHTYICSCRNLISVDPIGFITRTAKRRFTKLKFRFI